MDTTLKLIMALLFAYFVGALPVAWLIGRLVKGVDLRKVGTGSIGTSNVFYNVGKRWVLPVIAYDFLIKGPAAVQLAGPVLGLGLEAQVAAALLVIVGHNWPVFLGFHGGRGIAPTVGVLLVLAPIELALSAALVIFGWLAFRNSGLFVLFGISLLPVSSTVLGRPAPILGLTGGILALTVMKRLLSDGRGDPGIPMGQLLKNRLLYDRDIADHGAWVRRKHTMRVRP